MLEVNHYDLTAWNFILLVSLVIIAVVIVIILLTIHSQNQNIIKQKNSFKTKKGACIKNQYFGFLSKWKKPIPPENCRKCSESFECSHQQTNAEITPNKTSYCKPNQHFGLMKKWPKNSEMPKNCVNECLALSDCLKNKRRRK